MGGSDGVDAVQTSLHSIAWRPKGLLSTWSALECCSVILKWIALSPFVLSLATTTPIPSSGVADDLPPSAPSPHPADYLLPHTSPLLIIKSLGPRAEVSASSLLVVSKHPLAALAVIRVFLEACWGPIRPVLPGRVMVTSLRGAPVSRAIPGLPRCCKNDTVPLTPAFCQFIDFAALFPPSSLLGPS